MAFKGILICS